MQPEGPASLKAGYHVVVGLFDEWGKGEQAMRNKKRQAWANAYGESNTELTATSIFQEAPTKGIEYTIFDRFCFLHPSLLYAGAR